MAVPAGYTWTGAGYMRQSDGSGPYAADAAGNMTLISSAGVSRAPAPLSAGVDRSSSITAGGTAQQLAPANTARTKLTGQNISAGDLWINEIGGAAAVDGAGSYRVPSGAMFSINTNRAISIIGATLGQKFTATEL